MIFTRLNLPKHIHPQKRCKHVNPEQSSNRFSTHIVYPNLRRFHCRIPNSASLWDLFSAPTILWWKGQRYESSKSCGLQGLPASCSIKREVMTFVMFDVFTMDLLSHFRFIHCFIYTTHLSTHLVKTNKQWLRTAYFPRYQVGIGKCPHIVQALGTLPSSKSLIMAL